MPTEALADFTTNALPLRLMAENMSNRNESIIIAGDYVCLFQVDHKIRLTPMFSLADLANGTAEFSIEDIVDVQIF